MIKPILTEKSLEKAKKKVYTFAFDKNVVKSQVKKTIKDIFDVDVVSIKTMNYKSRTFRNVKGRSVTQKAWKKVLVSLKDGQKIDVFGAEEKK